MYKRQDLDNTLAPYGEPEPTQAVRDWAAALGEQGITLFVLSNNRHPERPRRFSQALGVPFLGHAGKPKPGGFRRAMEQMGCTPEQTAMTPPPESEPLRLVGEVFKTYIITERAGELCVIDKHAAHERILFEQLAKDYGNVPAQMLLVPVQVNLTAAEKQAVLQNIDLLTDAGIVSLSLIHI